MNKKIGLVSLLFAANFLWAQDSVSVAPMVAPSPIPAPADSVAAPAVDSAVAAALVAEVPAAPVAEAPAPAPLPAVAEVPPVPSVPVTETPQVSTGFTPEKVQPGKWTSTAKSDKNRPAKAENRERWRSNRIQHAERNAEIGRNDGRRLRIQALRLNKFEVKKEEGVTFSNEAQQLFNAMLAADMELEYYAPQDKMWGSVSRELERGRLSVEDPKEPRKQKYQQAEQRVPVLNK